MPKISTEDFDAFFSRINKLKRLKQLSMEKLICFNRSATQTENIYHNCQNHSVVLPKLPNFKSMIVKKGFKSGWYLKTFFVCIIL